MTRDEIIFKLHQAGYTFEEVGKLFGVSKQRAFAISKAQPATTPNKICDLCQKNRVSVKLQAGIFKLCRDCWKNVIRSSHKIGGL